MKLDGKVALLTGAGSGFGRACSLCIAREGARVVLVDVDERAIRQTREMLLAEGWQGTAVAADVSKKAMVETIPWGRVATVDDIANAAMFLVSDEAEMITGTCLQVDGGRGL